MIESLMGFSVAEGALLPVADAAGPTRPIWSGGTVDLSFQKTNASTSSPTIIRNLILNITSTKNRNNLHVFALRPSNTVRNKQHCFGLYRWIYLLTSCSAGYDGRARTTQSYQTEQQVDEKDRRG